MALIDRSGASALMPEDVAAGIIQDVPKASAALSLFRRTTMSRKQQRMPILNAFPEAYWVNGDTGRKQTTTQSWTNKYVEAEELAVIVPVPENVIFDTGDDYDIWGEVRPRILEAFGKKLDQAVFFGVDAPTSWPDSVSEACDTTDNEVKDGTGVDIADDVSAAFAKVEEDGFMVNGAVARIGVKHRLRNLRDVDGQPIFVSSLRDDGRVNSLYGERLEFLQNGAWVPGDAEIIVGDFSQGVIAIRQDITYKVLTEATITDGAGNIVYALAEQDMVALRAVMRVGFQVLNPKTQENPDDDTRYPFAVLRPSDWTGSAGSVS